MTGPLGKAETSTRSIPSSGYYLFADFLFVLSAVVVPHLSVCIMYYLFRGSCISHESSVYVKSSVGLPLFCLSVCFSVLPCPPLLGFIPGYFPTRMSYPCWEHVSLLPPLTPSSSHTGCLMAPSTTCCMKAPVSISTLVTKSALVTDFGGSLGFVI